MWRAKWPPPCAGYDTDFAADMTIMEEATEFMERLKTGENLPIITSCCPGWVKYCEEFYPEFLPNLSSCKSPQQIFGALAKTYYPQLLEGGVVNLPRAVGVIGGQDLCDIALSILNTSGAPSTMI